MFDRPHLHEGGTRRMHRDTGALERFTLKWHSERRRGDRVLDKRMTSQARAAFGSAVGRQVTMGGVCCDSPFSELAADQVGVGRARSTHCDIGLASCDVEHGQAYQQVDLELRMFVEEDC